MSMSPLISGPTVDSVSPIIAENSPIALTIRELLLVRSSPWTLTKPDGSTLSSAPI